MELIKVVADVGSNCLLVYIGLTFFNMGYKIYKDKKGGKSA